MRSNMLYDYEYNHDSRELKIPTMDFFSSSISAPPMSPQVSEEALFRHKERKEQEWSTCKKISGGLLWGPCFCDDCLCQSPKRELTPISDSNFLFPSSRQLVVRRKYFNPDSVDYPLFHGRPNVNLFDDDAYSTNDLDEVLTLPKKKRQPKRQRDDDDDLFSLEDYEYESRNRERNYFDLDDFGYQPPPTHLTKRKKKKKTKKSMSSGDSQRRSFNIMSLYEKGNRSRSETGYLGVRISTSGRRFRATVNYKGKPRNVGTFDTPHEAALEYDKKLLELSNWKIDRNRLNYCDQWDLEARKLLSSRRPRKRRRLSDLLAEKC